MRRSVYTNVTARESISVDTHASTVTGSSVDRNVGNDMHRTAMVMVHTGTITDGTHTISVEDSDDDTTYTAVDDQFLQGAAPEITSTGGGDLFFVGYIGPRRYLRVVSTVSGSPATGGVYGAVVVLGGPRRGPVEHS